MHTDCLKKGLAFVVIFLLIETSFASVLGNLYSEEGIIISLDLPKNNESVIVNVQNIGGRIELIYNIRGYSTEQVIIENEEYIQITLDDESNIMEKGCPDLPNICRSIVIPDDAKMSVEITDTEYRIYRNVLIAPSKGILPRTVDPVDIPYTFSDVYDEDRWFPKELAELDDPYILHGFRGQVVRVNPFQYNPMKKKLRVYNEIKIEVYPSSYGEINVYNRTRPLTSLDTDFKPIYEHHFLNFNMNHYTPVEEQGNMLVICYDSFYSTMKPFVTWKNMKGVPTEIVNVSAIGSTANEIDAYIENYYTANGLTFVLLVGDIDQIPTLAGGSNNASASDPSYSYIVGDDHYHDIFIGRFSAQTVEQLETQVERTIEYEKYPQVGADWYHKGTGIASDDGDGGDDGEYDWQHLRNIRADLIVGYLYTQVDELYEGSQGGADGTGNPTSSMVSNAVNNGRGIINYCGHGSATTWTTTGFDTTDINSLTNDNLLPFICCVACNNGEFDNFDTCFAEAWMRATNNGEPTGAIGVFASSQSQSWDPPMDAQDEIVDLLVNNTKNTFGGLSFSGCMHMMDEYGANCYNETDTWTVFGDPSLQVRTDTPGNITVNHADVLMIDASSFDVTVTGVEDALCAISYNGELLGYNYTDATGETTIQFDDLIGDMELVDFVVTAYNKKPYITTLEVTPSVRQPAEFEPMEGVLIRYPLGIPYDLIAEMAEDVEVVTIVANANEQSYVYLEYQSYGVDTNNCSFLIASSDSYWTRDYGPWFIFNDTTGALEVVNFTYNRPRPNDDRIPEIFGNDQGLTVHYMDLVHSGGNYMTDGQRIAVSTDLVWNENPETPDEINQTATEYLGINTYHVVPDVNNEYIRHIDCWAKFLAPDVIMIRSVPESHPQYDEIEGAVDYFANQLSCYGTPYTIERVYTPNDEPYTNSLILNDKVLVPITGVEWDDDALSSYESAMPGYEVLGFTALPGHPWESTDALHCRIKGIPDRNLLYIDHTPLTYMFASDDGFLIEADIISYSAGSLDVLSASVYWKNETRGWNTVSMNSNGDDSYSAYIPPRPSSETISYYILVENNSGKIEKHPYIGAADPHSFIVLNTPPYLPSDPYPESGSTRVTVDAILEWTSGDPDPEDIVTYDVYFGNSSPPPKVVSNQSGTSYNHGILEYDTLYFWKIVAWDEHGESAEGPIWSFTTMGIPPEITNVTMKVSDPIDTEPGFGWEDITCIVTDNVAVDEVKLVLTGDTTTEYPMIKDGDNYYCNITISAADEYMYHIWANDTSRNYNTSIPQPFDLPLNEDVDEDGKVHFMDFMAVAKAYHDEGPNGWVREDVDNNGKVHFMDLIGISRQYNEEW